MMTPAPRNIPPLAVALAIFLLPVEAGADQQTGPPPATGQQKSSATPVVAPVYKPPVRGAPGGRVGGGTRSLRLSGMDQTFTLSVLAPNHTGLTTQEQPVLYWYLSKPITTAVVFNLSDDGANPVAEQVLNPPFQAGIQRLRLADFGVRLEAGKQYRWFVAVVPDPKRRSKDILAGATIERTELAEAAAGSLAQSTRVEASKLYAEEGYWYDALSAVSEEIDANPDNGAFRSYRAALLRQIGLNEVAEQDENLAGGK